MKGFLKNEVHDATVSIKVRLRVVYCNPLHRHNMLKEHAPCLATD